MRTCGAQFAATGVGSRGTIVASRLEASRLTAEPQLFERSDGREPVCVSGLDFGVGDVDGIGRWLRLLEQRHGDREIPYRQLHSNGSREPRKSALRELLAMLSRGKSAAGVLAMDELVISRDDELRPRVPDLISEDFLDQLFPEVWRPPKFCLTLGTAGARCGMHTDPFGWTGWNLLLSGEKLWRFLLTGPESEKALYVEPRKPGSNLVGHGQSSVDLYGTGVKAALAGDFRDYGGPDLDRWPNAAGAHVICEVVQRAGEVIVFPAAWWHQTLHLSSTVAIASQYVNRRCARYVLDRMVTNAELDEASFDLGWRDRPWPEQIDQVLAALEADGWAPRRR